MIQSNVLYAYKQNNCFYFDVFIPENYILLARICNHKISFIENKTLNKNAQYIGCEDFKVTYFLYNMLSGTKNVMLPYNELNEYPINNKMIYHFFTPKTYEDINAVIYNEIWFLYRFTKLSKNSLSNNNRILKLINLNISL